MNELGRVFSQGTPFHDTIALQARSTRILQPAGRRACRRGLVVSEYPYKIIRLLFAVLYSVS